ncbi:Two component regulator with propeller domain [Tenacibaculum sp. 190524A02b]|uniref:histidine kinase n=1 Tax=Tenacibaculum vairaonense TaxID=3137860 RepID=A0ABM9PH25_9FLAO
MSLRLPPYYFILLFFFSSKIAAQTPIYKHFSSKDGLPHDITYGIIQDSNNYIWIGTDDGLTKFDGKKFTNYGYENGLTSNYVIDILELKEDKFAIATWGGGLHFMKNDTIYKSSQYIDDNNEKINQLAVLKDQSIYAKTAINSFSIYKKNKEKRWFLKAKDSYLLSKSQFFASSNKSYDISESVVDSIVFIHNTIRTKTTPNRKSLKGVHQLRNNQSIPSFKQFKNTPVYTIYKKSKEHKYYTGSDNTIYISNKTTISKRLNFNNIEHSKIIKILPYKNSIYFIANSYKTLQRKIYKYNTSTNKLSCLSELLKIDKMISDFLIDNQENLWITTYGNGVFFIPYTKNKFFSDETFSNSDLKSAVIIKNQLYLLATNKIYKLDNTKVATTFNFPIHSERITYNKHNNTLNILTEHQLSQFNKKTKNLNYKITSYDGYTIDSNGFLIKIVDNNITIYKDNKLVKKIANKFIVKKAIIKNDILYLLTKRKQLQVYDLQKNLKIKEYNRKYKFPAEKINNFLIKENGNLLLATNRGLFKVTKDTIQQFTTKNGLASNHINDLIIDKYGIIWLGTQRGLNVMHGKQFYTIDESQGQKSSFITKVISHNNYIYATGNKGLFRYDNSKPFKPNTLPPLKITQKNSSFTIFPFNLKNSKNVKIAYKLDDTNWTEANNTNFNFNYLDQGKHSIVFKYKDNLSYWKKTPPYHFTIIYPWYLQSWFYTLLTVVIAIIIIIFIIKLLQKSIQKNNELKNTIQERENLKRTLTTVRKNLAQDFHDELGNKLASITMLTNLLLVKNPEKNDTYLKLEKIKEDSNYLYSGMRDFVWSLNNNSDSLDEVLIYLSEFGKNLFNNTDIHFHVASEQPQKDTILPYYWSKQLIFIFKEAMTNALKHSKATEVTFLFSIINKELLISLSDNGVGFNIEEIQRQNGILNMKNRAKKINTQLFIFSDKQNTIITFKGHLNN